jgi:hypothetical protein
MSRIVIVILMYHHHKPLGFYKKTPWPESASGCHLSANLVPTFTDRGCHYINILTLNIYAAECLPDSSNL